MLKFAAIYKLRKNNLINTERRKIQAHDKQCELDRILLPQRERWKVEIREAFDYIADSLTPPPVVVVHQKSKQPPILLGRLGFKKLLRNGSLLGLPETALDELFNEADPNSACFITFDAFWVWFLHYADKKNVAIGKKANRTILGYKKKDRVYTAADAVIESEAFERMSSSWALADSPGTATTDFARNTTGGSRALVSAPFSPGSTAGDQNRGSPVRSAEPLDRTGALSLRPNTSNSAFADAPRSQQSGGRPGSVSSATGTFSLFGSSKASNDKLPGFYFRTRDIISAHDRAIIVLLRK